MKNKLFLLINFLLLLGFSSCEIREPESKPDITETGRQIFHYSETNIFQLVSLFDKALGINNYINTPDSMKEMNRQLYLSSYGVCHDKNKWYLKQNLDTVFSIVIDSNSIHTIGAVWKIKEQYADSFCTVRCLAFNKWQISSVENRYAPWIVNSQLNLNCSDSISPLSFRTADFSITGNGDLLSYGNSLQTVHITYAITDKLVHESADTKIASGSIGVVAIDLDTNQTESAIGEYIISTNQTQWMKITFKERIHTYQNWYTYFINP